MKSLRLLGRGIVLLLSRVFFGSPTGGAIGQVGSVLVIRTDERVGNVLLTVPLLRALRRGLPNAKIVFLHAASKGALVLGLPHVDRLEPFEKKLFFRRPWRFVSQLLRLRNERFDVVIEAGHYHAFSLTAALLSRFVRPRSIIGHERGMANWYFDHPVRPAEGVVQDVEVKLSLLGPLGIPEAGRELETPLSQDPEAISAMREALRSLGVDADRMLIVNPGARMAIRRWPPSEVGTMASRLAREYDLEPLIIWGPGEEELAKEVLTQAGPNAHLAPPTDLPQLAALLGLGRIFLTNDTGPMHLGVACGVPTLAIFLATDPRRWGHRLPGFVAVEIGEMEQEEATAAVLQAASTLPLPVPRQRAC